MGMVTWPFHFDAVSILNSIFKILYHYDLLLHSKIHRGSAGGCVIY